MGVHYPVTDLDREGGVQGVLCHKIGFAQSRFTESCLSLASLPLRQPFGLFASDGLDETLLFVQIIWTYLFLVVDVRRGRLLWSWIDSMRSAAIAAAVDGLKHHSDIEVGWSAWSPLVAPHRRRFR